MTTHELARKLLELPNETPVLIRGKFEMLAELYEVVEVDETDRELVVAPAQE